MSGERLTLQKASGQGKETGGIKYPIPSVNIIAILEQEYGPLEFLLDPVQARRILEKRALTEDEKSRVTGVNQLRMMIYLLEMQKAGKDEEVESMTSDERRKAAAKCMKMNKINITNFNKYAEAANAVFTRAPRLSRK